MSELSFTSETFAVIVLHENFAVSGPRAVNLSRRREVSRCLGQLRVLLGEKLVDVHVGSFQLPCVSTLKVDHLFLHKVLTFPVFLRRRLSSHYLRHRSLNLQSGYDNVFFSRVLFQVLQSCRQLSYSFVLVV